MPQDGSGNYDYPLGTRGIPDETIESAAYNNFIDDLRDNDLNKPRPIHRGGTGAINADAALVNLSAEKAAQLVTPSFDAHVWYPGSFRSTNAPGQAAPVDGHAFSGICYINEPLVNPPTNANVVVSARDLNDTVVPSRVYVREKKAGLWGDWTVIDATTLPFPPGGGIAGDTIIEAIQELDADKADKTALDAKVGKAGGSDGVMTGYLTLSGHPSATMHAATKGYVDGLIVSGTDINRNRLLNPAMEIGQDISLQLTTDMWTIQNVSAATVVGLRTTTPPTPRGSQNRLRLSVTAPAAVLNAGDYCKIRQGIEYIQMADTALGLIGPLGMVARFGWKSPAGTYSIAIQSQNTASGGGVVKNFTVTAGQANTDLEFTIVIQPNAFLGIYASSVDQLHMTFVFCIASGANGKAPLADEAWVPATPGIGQTYFANANNTNGLAATGVYELFDVGLYVNSAGGVPPAWVKPDSSQEVLRCQRYYHAISNRSFSQVHAGAGPGQIIEMHGVQLCHKQAITLTINNATAAGVASAFSKFACGTDFAIFSYTATGAGTATFTTFSYTLDARI